VGEADAHRGRAEDGAHQDADAKNGDDEPRALHEAAAAEQMARLEAEADEEEEDEVDYGGAAFDERDTTE